MAYVPPKYPGAIPTAEDLPNRADDVDWMLAARYNELKKELRAALTELGTDPAGTFDTVKARLDDLLPHCHDGGDKATYDWTLATLIEDGAYHDLDLSAIVPVGTKVVFLRVDYRASAVGHVALFKNKAGTPGNNRFIVRSEVANVIKSVDGAVACDSNRVIQYNLSSPQTTLIQITVGGWWK